MSIESAREAVEDAVRAACHEYHDDPCGECRTLVQDLILEAQADLLKAARVLAALVREEYPSGYSLTGIAEMWTPVGVTDEQIDALRRVEARLAAKEAMVDTC